MTTLQREYKEVTEDNERLIKFSSLSQYRVSRNINLSGNKENVMTVMNSGQVSHSRK